LRRRAGGIFSSLKALVNKRKKKLAVSICDNSMASIKEILTWL
jgi:hypothetical protein